MAKLSSKSKKAVVGGAISFGAGLGTGLILKKVYDPTIPFVPLDWPRNLSDLGMLTAGGILGIIAIIKKSHIAGGLAGGLLASGVINYYQWFAFRAKQRAMLATSRRSRQLMGRNPKQKSGITAIGRGQREFRSSVQGLDPQAGRRIRYKELSIEQPRPPRDIAKPYAGFQDAFTVASTKRGAPPKEQEQIKTFQRGQVFYA